MASLRDKNLGVSFQPRFPVYQTLVCLSGGIDSAWSTYDVLQSSKEPVLIFHLHLQNNQKRQEAETKAVEEILKYLVSKGFHSRFDVLEAHVDFGNVVGHPQDIELMGMFQAAITRKDRNYRVDSLTICRSKYDEQLTGYQRRSEARYKLIELLTYGNPPSYRYPIGHMDRSEIIEQMYHQAPGLLELTHFCRTPLEDGSSCRECKTCLNTFPDLERLGVFHR